MPARLKTRRRTVPNQAPLFDNTQPAPPTEPPPPSPPAAPPQTSRQRRNHTLDLPRPWKPMPCAAACLTCKRPEGLGLCPDGACAIVCGPPDKTGPVEVCLLTDTTPARLIHGSAVIHCPHCDSTHWHQPAPGRAYRIGACGQPYILLEAQ